MILVVRIEWWVERRRAELVRYHCALVLTVALTTSEQQNVPCQSICTEVEARNFDFDPGFYYRDSFSDSEKAQPLPPELDDKIQSESTLKAVVLCAADDVRDSIVFWLASFSVQTYVALSGWQANKIIRDDSHRLLITDRILPPWPGLGRINAVRGRKPNLRVAYIGAPDTRFLARTIGATDHLPQPMTRQALAGVLAQLTIEH